MPATLRAVFGTLRIARDALDVEGRALYRAAFCAGCHALHDLCGRPSSLLSNYDQTVLALVLAGLGRAAPIEGRACTALPFRTITVQPLGDAARALLAALNVAAVRAKLADDVEDGDRPLLKRTVLRALRGPGAKARAALVGLGFPVSLFDELPAAQRALESAPGSVSIEALARPSAELTGQIFAHAALAVERVELAPALQRFGAALGAWIYAFDAWQDLADDVRLGRFNAWVAAGVVTPGGRKPGARALQARATAPAIGSRWGSAEPAPAIAAHLDALLDAAGAARGELPLGAHGAVIDALLASLRVRSRAVRTAKAPGATDRRQAGDCDCSCGDCCCDGGNCCCGAGGSGIESCVCPCCECACWERDPQRRTVRRVRHARRRDRSVAAIDLAPLIGSQGEAETDLLPAGRVIVRGLTFDARATSGMIERGAAVVVTEVDGGKLVVERASREP